MHKILVVEDNELYLDELKDHLLDAGYDVDYANNPVEGLEIFAKNQYDLVISDLVMKEFDGVRFLSTVKNIDPTVNTVILTGKPNEETEMKALESQIDYYITKDRNFEVITKYIQSLLDRRALSSPDSSILESKAESIVLHKKRHEVLKEGEKVNLTPREYQILKFFLENKYVTLSRMDIINDVWGNPEEDIDERVIDLHIKNLRHKLRLVSIITVRGYGYKWNE